MRKPLWLLLAHAEQPGLALALPSMAWMAREAGALFESYGEARRDGRLFARSGSTVLGGAHHQAFNYLCAAFDVRAIVWGESQIFSSSLQAFNIPILARSDSLPVLYEALLKQDGVAAPNGAVVAPVSPLELGGSQVEIAPYLLPDIFFARALAFPAAQAREAARLQVLLGAPARTLYLSDQERAQVLQAWPQAPPIDEVRPGDNSGTITLRIARRWKHRARGVVFGDPPAVLSQAASHCRHERVALFAPKAKMAPHEIRVAEYTEATSAIAREAAQLALEIGNPILVGRQTGDGDLFEWSKSGVCIQIVDPNRPAFPILDALPHVWASPSADIFEDEPDDAQLEAWVEEGKVLSTLLWHSGEVAHNEAMLALFDLAAWSGAKMGIGVHAQRYETAPQTWEMLSISRERGGVRGLIEPILHSGGLGVLAEINCPPKYLRAHCEESLSRIRALAGQAGAPVGYYAFMDSDLETLTQTKPEAWEAVSEAGLEYFVSSARPGRNRAWEARELITINQTCRSVYTGSPFVRLTTAEEVQHASPVTRPGWFIGTLDAPVVAFGPYIWRHGSRFMQVLEAVRGGGRVNVLPRTVSRYARLLARRGMLPST